MTAYIAVGLADCTAASGALECESRLRRSDSHQHSVPWSGSTSTVNSDEVGKVTRVRRAPMFILISYAPHAIYCKAYSSIGYCRLSARVEGIEVPGFSAPGRGRQRFGVVTFSLDELPDVLLRCVPAETWCASRHTCADLLCAGPPAARRVLARRACCASASLAVSARST